MMKRLDFLIQIGLASLMFTVHATAVVTNIPPEFVDLGEVDPTIIQNPRYAGTENFLGTPVPGYRRSKLYCTFQTALALKQANTTFHKLGYNLVVYDAYRPQRAVNAFIDWSQSTGHNAKKDHYFPTIPKNKLFALGYLAEKSGHSRGSTVDLTLIRLDQSLQSITISHRTLQNGESIPFLDDNTVDMGSSFDLFHSVSSRDSPLITEEQTHRRKLLRSTMEAHGFEGINEEWWHYTLLDEPYPNTYFDFIPPENASHRLSQ